MQIVRRTLKLLQQMALFGAMLVSVSSAVFALRGLNSDRVEMLGYIRDDRGAISATSVRGLLELRVFPSMSGYHRRGGIQAGTYDFASSNFASLRVVAPLAAGVEKPSYPGGEYYYLRLPWLFLTFSGVLLLYFLKRGKVDANGWEECTL